MGHLKASVPANAAELIVVRHGETTWNASGRLQGQAESDLSDVGVKQAQAVADRLGRGAKDVAAIYSSDLRRASETAQLIAVSCGCNEVIMMDSLRERHLGKLQGFTRAEAMIVEPQAFQASTSNEHDEPIPGGGESLNQLYSRTKAAMEEIARKHLGKRVVIVTHGGVLRALHQHVEGRLPSGRGIGSLRSGAGGDELA